MSHDENMQELHDFFKQTYHRMISNDIVLNKYYQSMEQFSLKKKLPFSEYLSQLEKNVIYNKFLFTSTLSKLMDYIYNPIKLSNDIEDNYFYILNTAQQEAHSYTVAIIDYLSTNGKPLPSITDDIKHFYNLKKENKLDELVEELEFQIQYYKSHYEIITYITLQIVQAPELSQFISSKFHKGEAMEEFRAFTRQAINYLLNQYSLN